LKEQQAMLRDPRKPHLPPDQDSLQELQKILREKDSLIKELKAQFNVEKLVYQQNLEEKDKIIDQLKLNQVTN
jgi:hypothetical protein